MSCVVAHARSDAAVQVVAHLRRPQHTPDVTECTMEDIFGSSGQTNILSHGCWGYEYKKLRIVALLIEKYYV